MKYAVEDEEEMPKRKGLGRAAAGEERESSNDAEITLGTRSLLGIFFGLVLICGIFFGLGYSVGRVGAAKGAGETASTDAGGTLADGSHLAKPSPQQGALPVPAITDTTAAATTPGATTAPGAVPPAGAPGTVPVGGAVASGTASLPAATSVPALTPAAETVTTPAASAVPAVEHPAVKAQAATLVVQVAAVGVAQDAQTLVAVLRQHGFNAVIRREPTDALLHVQIGPFATKADAEAMRGRLQANGYNAVIK
jgi:cell division protein FtsN